MNFIKKFHIILLFLLLTATNVCFSQDFLLSTLTNELDFQKEKFAKNENKPYFIQFNATEIYNFQASSLFGSLISSDIEHARYFYPELRIGNYKIDNTHISDNMFSQRDFYFGGFPTVLSIEDSLFQISKAIRKSVNEDYKKVLEVYIKKNKKYNNAEENNAISRNDFSKAHANQYYEEPYESIDFNVEKWENTLNYITESFRKNDYIKMAGANVVSNISRTYNVNNEGSSIVQNKQISQLNIILLIKCDDDNLAPIVKSYYAFSLDGLPNKEKQDSIITEIKNIVNQLKIAPSAEPYTGPCIMSASTSGVFFHEIFGHRIEGDRLNSIKDAQTFKNKIGDKILPDILSVTFNPTIKKYKNTDLMGYYKYDDQAVKAKEVKVVKNGKLVEFLMSRTPIDSVSISNGHGRSSFGMSVVSRQSNMFVESSERVSEEQLRKYLIKECKKQKKKFGLYFKEVSGGYTSTTKFSPNVFNILPTEVYKVYVDGRPDELIKGVSLIGTPLTMFSEISYVGDGSSVFNGYCGAESGFVPVSTIAPSILVNKIETQRTFEIKNEESEIIRPDLIK